MHKTKPTPSLLKVVALVFDQVTFFELGIAVECFGLPRAEFRSWYDFSVCSPDPAPLRTSGGMEISVRSGLRSLATAGTIVVPGWRNINESPAVNVLNALRRAYHRGARLISFCSGAFVLAAAGLLDGKQATTHWRYADQLATRFPLVHVNPNVLYVEEGNILTAAGSASGIDLCLHLVRKDFGTGMANAVARRLVVAPHRDGGQAQFIDRPVTVCSDGGLSELLSWLSANLEKVHTVPSMAKRLHMSPRTFARQFRRQTGTTPANWLKAQRVQHAQHLLEATEFSIDQVAAKSGFDSSRLLRLHFRRVTNTSPSNWRSTFRGKSAVL